MKRYILLISVIAALTSCVQGPEIQPTTPTRAVSIDAVATKTMYDGTNIVWESGDEVSVFFHHSTSGYNVTRFSSNVEQGQTATKAKFSGAISSDVALANGYGDFGYAVYPTTVAVEGGKIMYDLPSSQVAGAKGSFQSGLNLASSVILLSDIEDDGSASAYFRNALSYIRINLTEDVKSVTVTGTAPLAGKAPLVVGSDDKVNDSYGRLMVDSSAEWSASSKSVTLTPSVGQTFEAGTYNLLIWPGTHTGLTVTLNFNEYGEYNKLSKISTEKPFTFVAGKYYSMNVNNTEELVIEEILTGVHVPEVDSDLEAEIEALLSQVQSVSLMTEYLDNAAYARYSKFGSTNVKQDIELSYMVRPVEIAEQLVEKYSEALSAVVTYPGPAEYTTLPVNDASLTDDGILTVSIDADGISNDFYSGAESAKLALQISSGRSDLLSDFANLHPKIGASLDFTRSKDIPVLKGARVSIPFKYAPNGDTYELSVSSNSEVSLRDNSGFFNGYVNVDITDSDLASQSVTVTMNSGGEVIEEVLTFADAGKFDISYLSTVDYVGGEVNVFVEKSESYGAYTMTLSNTTITTDYKSKIGEYDNGTPKVQTKTYYNTWIREKNSGVPGTYFIDENGPTKATVTGPEGTDIQLEVNNEGINQRTAYLNFEVKNANPAVNGDLTYTPRSISITQKAYNTGFEESLYHSSGTVLTLKTATSNTREHLNLVILADGYKKAHLLKTGTFEGLARTAADVFLNAIDSVFHDRFNVYALVRESSSDEIAANASAAAGNTYYESFRDVSVNLTATGLGRLKEDVKSICPENTYDYYRTVSILLINANIDGAATGYDMQGKISNTYVGDGYKSFAYSYIPANSMGTKGFIRHEAVGHALGRLGDEYYVDSYTVSKVNDYHNNHGFYRNIATTTSYWSNFTAAGYGADEVGYIQYTNNGLPVNNGLYRSTNDSGIMFNNNGTFNAVSRWAIYDRIRKQTEGNGDYWNDFLIWDNKNRKK